MLPATAITSDCASDVNQALFLASPCRQRHSLTLGLSPEAQFDARPVVRHTVWLVTMGFENGIPFAGMGEALPMAV